MAGIATNRCHICSVGIHAANDHMEIVIPCGFNTGGHAVDVYLDDYEIVTSFEATMLPLLLDCLSVSAEVLFINSVGMINGFIPYRKEYATGAQVGTRAGALLPSTVGLIVGGYADPDVPTPTGKIASAHNIIPGISKDDVVNDVPVAGLLAAGLAFQTALQATWTSVNYPGEHIRRVSGIDRVSPSVLAVVGVAFVRNYIGTQRRRILPH